MAKMIGKIKHTWFNSCRLGCCIADTNKTTVNRSEIGLALSEAEDEMHGFERDHENGICSDPRTGMGGCNYCYPDDEEANGPEDLEGIEGVTFGQRS